MGNFGSEGSVVPVESNDMRKSKRRSAFACPSWNLKVSSPPPFEKDCVACSPSIDSSLSKSCLALIGLLESGLSHWWAQGDRLEVEFQSRPTISHPACPSSNLPTVQSTSPLISNLSNACPVSFSNWTQPFQHLLHPPVLITTISLSSVCPLTWAIDPYPWRLRQPDVCNRLASSVWSFCLNRNRSLAWTFSLWNVYGRSYRYPLAFSMIQRQSWIGHFGDERTSSFSSWRLGSWWLASLLGEKVREWMDVVSWKEREKFGIWRGSRSSWGLRFPCSDWLDFSVSFGITNWIHLDIDLEEVEEQVWGVWRFKLLEKFCYCFKVELACGLRTPFVSLLGIDNLDLLSWIRFCRRDSLRDCWWDLVWSRRRYKWTEAGRLQSILAALFKHSIFACLPPFPVSNSVLFQKLNSIWLLSSSVHRLQRWAAATLQPEGRNFYFSYHYILESFKVLKVNKRLWTKPSVMIWSERLLWAPKAVQISLSSFPTTRQRQSRWISVRIIIFISKVEIRYQNRTRSNHKSLEDLKNRLRNRAQTAALQESRPSSINNSQLLLLEFLQSSSRSIFSAIQIQQSPSTQHNVETQGRRWSFLPSFSSPPSSLPSSPSSSPSSSFSSSSSSSTLSSFSLSRCLSSSLLHTSLMERVICLEDSPLSLPNRFFPDKRWQS